MNFHAFTGRNAIDVINLCPKKGKEMTSAGFKVRTSLSVKVQKEGLG